MHISSDAELANCWLLQHLTRTIPELTRPDATDDVRVTAVRRWLHRNLCAADDATAITRHGLDISLTSPAILLWNSIRRTAGVYCTGAAEAARRVYELLGYRACLFDMGDPASCATHSVTLVEITHAGQKRVTIHDAYFGCTLRYVDGSLVDFSDLMRRLDCGGIADIRFDHDAQLKWLLYGADKDVPSILRHYGFRHERIVRLPAGHQAVLAEWHLPGFLRGEPRYGKFLQQCHGTANPLWLFRSPLFTTPNCLGLEIEANTPAFAEVA